MAESSQDTSNVATERPGWRQLAMCGIAVPIGLIAFATFVGIGGARQSASHLVAFAAMTLVYLPPLVAALIGPPQRFGVFGISLTTWCGILLLVVPVYFPGERADAIATGIAMLTRSASWEDMARSVAEPLDDDEPGHVGELVTALRLTTPPSVEGLDVTRRVTVPVRSDGALAAVFAHGDVEHPVHALRDQTASHTLVRPETLAALGVSLEGGVEIGIDAGAGRSLVPMALLDAVALGGESLSSVLVGACMSCPEGVDAVLGANVTSAFAWRERSGDELDVTIRMHPNRRLDVEPFVQVAGRFVRFPGGLVQVKLGAENEGHRPVRETVARVRCGASQWLVPMGYLGPGERVFLRRRLPEHTACSSYEVELDAAQW